MLFSKVFWFLILYFIPRMARAIFPRPLASKSEFLTFLGLHMATKKPKNMRDNMTTPTNKYLKYLSNLGSSQTTLYFKENLLQIVKITKK